jgi:hypothetical protein
LPFLIFWQSTKPGRPHSDAFSPSATSRSQAFGKASLPSSSFSALTIGRQQIL